MATHDNLRRSVLKDCKMQKFNFTASCAMITRNAKYLRKSKSGQRLGTDGRTRGVDSAQLSNVKDARPPRTPLHPPQATDICQSELHYEEEDDGSA